jgi:hypothetical protein
MMGMLDRKWPAALNGFSCCLHKIEKPPSNRRE